MCEMNQVAMRNKNLGTTGILILPSTLIFLLLILILQWNLLLMFIAAGSPSKICDCLSCVTHLTVGDFYFRYILSTCVALASFGMHVVALVRPKRLNWGVSVLCFIFTLFMAWQCDVDRHCVYLPKG